MRNEDIEKIPPTDVAVVSLSQEHREEDRVCYESDSQRPPLYTMSYRVPM